MIRYNPKSWLSQIFNVAKSDTLSILWKELVFLAVLTSGITYIEMNFFDNSLNDLQEVQTKPTEIV